jgi:hypothetical protein
MCKPDFIAAKKTSVPTRHESKSLLHFETLPSVGPMAACSGGIVAFLFAIEYALRFALNAYQVSSVAVTYDFLLLL